MKKRGREKEKGEREGRERVKKGSEQVLTCEHGERRRKRRKKRERTSVNL